MSEPVWETHEGEGIPLSEMENGHLLNIERMLLGRGATDWADREILFEEWYGIIRDEIDRRGLTPLATHPTALGRQEVKCHCGPGLSDWWQTCSVHGFLQEA